MGEDHKYDRTLHLLDRMLVFGHEPGVLLHHVFGTGISAHVLSYVYLWFLPLVPLALTAWLIWSKNITYGYWFATSQSLAWSLGTLSYYALPTLGPGLAYPSIYTDLPDTPTSALMETLVNIRQQVVLGGFADAVQSVAGLRQPAHRDHPAGRADGAVHGPEPGAAHRLLGQLRPHRSWPPSTSAGTTSPTTSPA